MKKIYFIFLALFLLMGCSVTVIRTRNEVVQASNVLDIRVDKIVGREIFLELENKTNDIVEVKLTESTLNDSEILDINKMQTNDSERYNSYNDYNNYNNYNNYNYYRHNKDYKYDKDYKRHRDNEYYYTPMPVIVQARPLINEKISDIILNPRERITIKVGSRNLKLPMKIILKYAMNNKVGFVSVNVEGLYIENR